MIRKQGFSSVLLKTLHKLARYTKEQKTFALYLIALTVFLVLFPILSFSSIDKQDGYSVWLLSGSFWMTALIVFISLVILLGWNMSYRFKNIVINVFGFRENEDLFNLGFLWVIMTAFISVGDTVSSIQQRTMTVTVTWWYHLIKILLIVGVVLTLIAVKKKVNQSDKTKIVNMVDEEALRDVKTKQSVRGLFDDAKGFSDEKIEE